MSLQPCFVGIDVSQASLDIAVRPTAETWQVSNDEAGITTLVPQLQALAPRKVEILDRLYSIEIPQIRCILGHAMMSLLPT